MANWQWLYFIPFAFIAIVNFKTLLDDVIKKQEVMYAPVVGLIAFFLATLTLDNNYNRLIWLFVLLDVGTLFLIVHLPFLFKESFVNSRFCRYRVYQNDTQILTLYKFKDSQTFNWQYTAKIEPSETPTLVGFGGDWQINHQQLQLMRDNEILAVADIHHQGIMFRETQEYYYFLHHQYFKQIKPSVEK